MSPRFNTLLDNLPGMVFQCRSDWNHTLEYVSNGCYNLTGYEAEELVMNRLTSYGNLIYPEDREMVWINLQSAAVQRKSFELVYRIHTRNRQLKWVRERGMKATGDNNHLMEGYITDITDWKLAEEKIQRQVRRFQALRAVDSAISTGPNLQFTLGILLEQIMSQLNVDASAILLFRPITQELEYQTSRGFRTDSFLHSRLELGSGLAGRVAQTLKTTYLPNISSMPTNPNQPLPIAAEEFKLYYGVPLVAKGQIKGVLEIFLRNETPIDRERLEFSKR
jgi:hypothetical protein